MIRRAYYKLLALLIPGQCFEIQPGDLYRLARFNQEQERS